MADEHALNFFHGALLDEDADAFLTQDGDYLLQAKPDRRFSPPKLILAIRKQAKVRRIEIIKLDPPGAGFRFLNKTYPDLHQLINQYSSRPLEFANGESILLKRPISKGKYSFTHKDIKLQRKIGSGAYGTVYKGLMNRDNRPIAVKRIDSDGKNDQALIDMMTEARVMQILNHPNVVKFYGYIVDRTPYLLVMELCSDGAVEDKLRSLGRAIQPQKRVNYSMQASRGIEYLHSKACIHRDIATRNCLLHGSVLKLADFGMCRATTCFKIDLTKPQNVRWLAPEVWRTAETKLNTDIYAFGIMLWELFEMPYKTPYQEWPAYTVKERVMSGYRLPTPREMPDPMVLIMKRCWDHDPDRRLTATEARRHLELVNQGYSDDDNVPTGRFEVVDQNNNAVAANHNNTKSSAGNARSRSVMMNPSSGTTSSIAKPPPPTAKTPANKDGSSYLTSNNYNNNTVKNLNNNNNSTVKSRNMDVNNNNPNQGKSFMGPPRAM